MKFGTTLTRYAMSQTHYVITLKAYIKRTHLNVFTS